MFNIDMDKIKDKAKSLSEMASEAFVKTVNVAEHAANVTKVKFKITSKEMEIKDAYKDIGKLVYTAYKNEEDLNDDNVAEKCVFIDKCLAEIDELKASIEKKDDDVIEVTEIIDEKPEEAIEE